MSINWDEEPVAIVGVAKAILELAAASGLALSDQTTGSIVSGVTAIATLAAAYFIRRRVSSPATAKTQLAQAGLLSAKLATISSTPFGGNGVAGYGQGFPTDTTLTFTLLAKDDGASQAWLNAGKAAARLSVPRRALGRNVNHDPRSWNYAVAELPTIASQHWTRRAPIFDQGNLGSCTGNAAAGWLATDDASRQGLTTLPDGTAVDENLAVSIYSAATKLDSITGTYPPTDTGSDGLSVAKVLQARSLCSSYQHAFTIAAVYSALQTGPGMAGTVWYNSMFDTDADGHIKVDPSSGEAGGHEYVISRLVVDNGSVTQIWMDNSWGPNWGVGGSGYFTPAEFTALLQNSGDFTVPIFIPAPAPGPTPTPVPDASFQTAFDAVPGLDAWLAKQAKRYNLTVPGYLAKLAAATAHIK